MCDEVCVHACGMMGGALVGDLRVSVDKGRLRNIFTRRVYVVRYLVMTMDGDRSRGF